MRDEDLYFDYALFIERAGLKTVIQYNMVKPKLKRPAVLPRIRDILGFKKTVKTKIKGPADFLQFNKIMPKSG